MKAYSHLITVTKLLLMSSTKATRPPTLYLDHIFPVPMSSTASKLAKQPLVPLKEIQTTDLVL